MSESSLHSTLIRYRTGIGRSMKRFATSSQAKPCVMGGVIIDDTPGFIGKTDGDVIIEAISSAISSLSSFHWQKKQLELEAQGITSSHELLLQGVKTLEPQTISSIALCIEGKIPSLDEIMITQIKQNLASLLNIHHKEVGITTLTGEGLDECGCGEGVDCIATITTVERL